MTITDPGYVLQAAIVSELKSNGGVSAIVGSRVFDRVARKLTVNTSHCFV
jgi:hypothetical protein